MLHRERFDDASDSIIQGEKKCRFELTFNVIYCVFLSLFATLLMSQLAAHLYVMSSQSFVSEKRKVNIRVRVDHAV